MAELDAMALFLLFHEGEEKAQNRRQVLFDVRRDHPFQLRGLLNRFDPFVEKGHRDHDLGPAVDKGSFQLPFRVDRIHGRNHAARLPDAELSDNKLGTVGKKKGYPVAFLDTQIDKGCGKGVTRSFQLSIAQTRPLKEDCRMVRSLSSRLAHVIEKGPLGIGLEAFRNPCVIMP